MSNPESLKQKVLLWSLIFPDTDKGGKEEESEKKKLKGRTRNRKDEWENASKFKLMQRWTEKGKGSKTVAKSITAEPLTFLLHHLQNKDEKYDIRS
jgi:hypothetical protein